MATTAAVGAKEGPRWGEKKREKKKKERKEWSLVLNDKKKVVRVGHVEIFF